MADAFYIDSHAHLTGKEFDEDREQVLERADAAGVRYIVNPGTTLEDSRQAIALAERHDAVYACVGIHPHEARLANDRSIAELEELAQHPKVVAIGEIGLDYHYDFSPRDVQQRVFSDQLALAAKLNKPVVIHTREAESDTLRLVQQAVDGAPGWCTPADTARSRYPAPHGVLHCFPADVAMAWQVVNIGFFVSFPGIVTFKKNKAATVAANLSPEHFLLETDSPYLTPEPLRGKRNEPANIPLIAARLAELQDLSPQDIARATSYNVTRLFGIGGKGAPRFTYLLRNAIYVNLTLRCNADCVFCDRSGNAVLKGMNLRIDREPTAQEVIEEIGDPRKYDEVVFCGYGEPTIRIEELKEIAQWVKKEGGKTRINTNGHGNVINKRNIIPELVGLIDAVSISLNSADPEQYGALMRLNPATFFPSMVEFAREAVRSLQRVTMTIVDLPEVDKERARRLAEEIGARFSIRPYF